MRPEQFEFVDATRGAFARLRWQRHEVTLTTWPDSFLAMWRADVLGPQARAEAERLARRLDQEGTHDS